MARLLVANGKSPPLSPSVIYWTNQNKAANSMLFCDWLTILRPGWRQVAVHWSANNWTCVHKVCVTSLDNFARIKKCLKTKCPFFALWQFLIQAILSELQHFRHFSTDRVYIFVQLCGISGFVPKLGAISLFIQFDFDIIPNFAQYIKNLTCNIILKQIAHYQILDFHLLYATQTKWSIWNSKNYAPLHTLCEDTLT